jgi:hypothetical protein
MCNRRQLAHLHLDDKGYVITFSITTSTTCIYMNISWEERQISHDKATTSTHDLANSSHNLGPRRSPSLNKYKPLRRMPTTLIYVWSLITSTYLTLFDIATSATRPCKKQKEKEKKTPVFLYRREGEPVGLVLIIVSHDAT